jgi:outer membrane protein assembly factor BamB
MIRGRPVRIWFLLPLLAVVGACSDSSTEPAAPMSSGVFVLNSTGQTLASFSVLEGLEVGAPPTDLGAGFDGDAFDLTTSFAVTTVSAFGGSRLLFVDLASGDVLTTSFPAPQSDLTNPSAASFDPQGTAWVGGRSSDAIYRAIPGDLTAVRVASGVGTFIERVVPHGDRLYVIDANIDDDAGSYEPLGPGRVVVLSRVGAEEQVIDLPPAALNPTEAVVTEGALLVLASGTFDPTTFLPASDGSLVAVDLATGQAGSPVPLAANGVSMKLGSDGFVYVTTTSDYQTLDLLRFDPVSGTFARGPADPIPVRGEDGGRVDCWSATALSDGRIVCVTFSFAEAGRLVLTDDAGGFLDEAPSGFGSTDVASR